MNISLKRWRLGLIVAGLSGFLSVFVVGNVDPDIPFRTLLFMMIGFVAKDLYLYLQQNPVDKVVGIDGDEGPKTPKVSMLCLFGLAGMLIMNPGCGTTPLNVATKTDGVVVISVNTAMKGWHDWVVAGKATQAQVDEVKSAYKKYYDAQRIAEQTLLVYNDSPLELQAVQAPQVQQLLKDVTAAEVPLIDLIQQFTHKK